MAPPWFTCDSRRRDYDWTARSLNAQSAAADSPRPGVPGRAGTLTTPMRITEDHAAHLRKHGFVVVRGFLTPEEVRAAKANLLQYVPTAEELAATPHR